MWHLNPIKADHIVDLNPPVLCEGLASYDTPEKRYRSFYARTNGQQLGMLKSP